MSHSLVDQFAQKIRAGGGRMTGQCQLILEAVERHPNHPSAEEIYARVRKADPAINLSTVYRTLRWLEENDFIASRRLKCDGRSERFDTIPPSQPPGDQGVDAWRRTQPDPGQILPGSPGPTPSHKERT